jgi:hypothetical protein
MKVPIILIVPLCVASISCDEAKSLVGKAKAAVESRINQAVTAPEDTTPDPELQKLVDQTPEGFIFRKDLPFPTRFEVKTVLNEEISGRIFETSAIRNQVTAQNGTRSTVSKFERSGDQVRYTLEKSTFTDPIIEGADDSKKPLVKELAPPSKPQVYHKVGSTWKSEYSEGFRAVALSRQLSPSFDLLLVENALAPRSLWFGKKRLKLGDQMKISGKTLPMLLSGEAKGMFTLTLESIGAVKGHPCGVFNFTGDYSRKQIPDFEGAVTDEDVTVQSGKLWLSLIYPLVLRQEAETIQTVRQGVDGNAGTRLQGSVKISLIREWKKL